MINKKTIVLLGILTFCSEIGLAQENLALEEELVEGEETEGRHSIGFVMSHTRIGEGRDANGEKEFLTVPSFAIDYNYWLSERFALGLHTDFIYESFIIEVENDELIEREFPVAPVVMATYKPGKHWTFGLGFGGEFASDETLFVTRLAVEYLVEIRNGWGVFGSLTQDFRATTYNTTSLGIGIEKRFGK